MEKTISTSIEASTPGKLILLGEYAVLDGAEAAVIAINRLARVRVQPQRTGTNTLQASAIDIKNLSFQASPSGDIAFPPDLDDAQFNKLAFFNACYQVTAGELNRKGYDPIPSADIELDTSAFFDATLGIKLGFGSSAALSVATIAALAAAAGIRLTARRCFELALEAHHFAQGKMGSGIDIAASAFGGLLQYRIADNDEEIIRETTPLTLPEDLHLRFVWSGRSASTRELVAKVRSYEKEHPYVIEGIFAEMASISRDGIAALKAGKTGTFLEAVSAYHKAMDRLGKTSGADIISAEHQQIAEIAAQNQCHYKPSGAGGGDFGIVFGRDAAEIENCALQISQAGFNIMSLTMVKNGVVISEDKDR